MTHVLYRKIDGKLIYVDLLLSYLYRLEIYIVSEMTDDTLGLSTGKCKYDKKNFSNMNSKINI